MNSQWYRARIVLAAASLAAAAGAQPTIVPETNWTVNWLENFDSGVTQMWTGANISEPPILGISATARTFDTGLGRATFQGWRKWRIVPVGLNTRHAVGVMWNFAGGRLTKTSATGSSVAIWDIEYAFNANQEGGSERDIFDRYEIIDTPDPIGQIIMPPENGVFVAAQNSNHPFRIHAYANVCTQLVHGGVGLATSEFGGDQANNFVIQALDVTDVVPLPRLDGDDISGAMYINGLNVADLPSPSFPESTALDVTFDLSAPITRGGITLFGQPAGNPYADRILFDFRMIIDAGTPDEQTIFPQSGIGTEAEIAPGQEQINAAHNNTRFRILTPGSLAPGLHTIDFDVVLSGTVETLNMDDPATNTMFLASGFVRIACPPDWDGNFVLDVFDVMAFLDDFAAAAPAADLTGDGVHDFFDVLAFLTYFSGGCP